MKNFTSRIDLTWLWLIIFMLVGNATAQTVPLSGGGGSQQGGGGQQGGSATTVNNGYSTGTRVPAQGSSVRLNLRLMPQPRAQTTTNKQLRMNLRLGRHGFIQPNNANSNNGGGSQQGGGTTGGGTTGGGTTGGGTTGGGTTGGGTTPGT